MKRKALYGSILISFWVVFLLAFPGFSATPEPQSEQAKQIKALVDKAAALIESKGKDAFPVTFPPIIVPVFKLDF